ncbi:MAG: bifunctional 2-polyprenyl-6-hydroxyphenol methylase/3-demethylubiquinol 3-O-methyltransferase UbiG [Acidocella sp.]|nr:bifunctional 2-polyprenyl-6-hydroxyphenol methylase/3-demethylubiquinol 3-O-methyltransferase UbiG [Acidocella sp.]
MSQSVDAADIARFDALAGQWWDPRGPMRPLHMMNPIRAGWVLNRIAAQFGGPAVDLLDVGCGAGLLSEALAGAGARVLGLDAATQAIAAAQAHAEGRGLPLSYRVGTAEALVSEGAKFQVITALEVIEHVPDQAAFIATLAALLVPGGLLFISTLNRTPRAFLAAKIGAEYLLRLLPIGTHNWRQFVTPAELATQCRAAGLRLSDIAGLSFTARPPGFRVTRDTSINYIALAQCGAV